MRDSAELAHLLEELEQRHVALTRDDVQWAFESPQTKADIEAWVKEYLGSDTLLSKEEVELITKKDTLRETRPDQEHLSTTRPILDHELQTSVDALENSVTAIETQCKILEAQKEAFLSLRARNRERTIASERAMKQRLEKHRREKALLDVAGEAISDTLDDQLSDSQRQANSAAALIPSFANECLSADDRLLAGLSKLTPKLQPLHKGGINTKVIDQWCRSLVAFRAADVKSRIDRAYLESLAHCDSVESPSASSGDQDAETEALRQELETLHAEITPVLEMVVDHELRTPIIQGMELAVRQETQSRQALMRYILSSIQHMTSRLDIVSTHAQNLHALSMALAEISSIIEEERPSISIPSSNPPMKPARQGKPRPMQRSESGLRELVLVRNNTTSDSPTSPILRHLDIPMPPSDSRQRRKLLDVATSDRRSRLNMHIASAEGLMTQSVADALGKADADLQALMAAVYAHSEYSSINLVNPELKQGLQELDFGVAEVGRLMGRLDGESRRGAEAKKEQLISKWGGK
ncbi:hypothetical protein LTR16_000862 [Cryomyces antarcticus]|uniref:HAUS augmin-like complex subunit 3 N-terminal domain-containing protein n=1 Tax=Cryomyces antarcticus TaxID=329879 RepID=A0ABR0LRY9_9PEZI|nr:hypothetical protein LTR39_001253 [Cryomyces antarcticus]KAK5019145.1 hypothetical protein LTR60_001219 [Cryomyces antarcticus]KAK5201957.1 hypothetical protein LTR16_000862 [Cryomyces antarcticus]